MTQTPKRPVYIHPDVKLAEPPHVISAEFHAGFAVHRLLLSRGIWPARVLGEGAYLGQEDIVTRALASGFKLPEIHPV